MERARRPRPTRKNLATQFFQRGGLPSQSGDQHTESLLWSVRCVAVRAKGDNRVSKRRQSVVSKRRLSEQKETNADALLCGLLVLVGSVSATAHDGILRTPSLGAAWNAVNNGLG